MTRTRTALLMSLVGTLSLLLFAGPGCRRRAGPGAEAAGQVLYRCPMHPTYVSERPGDCPICGMKLVAGSAPGAASSPEAASAVAGRAVVALSPEKRQMLGVRTSVARRTSLDHVIRTVGRLAVDERRVHHIHTKYEGYVEHLYVDFTGKFVTKGEPLLSIYSPELVATQQEYLLALRARERLAASGIGSVAKGGADLLEAARQRLLFWDIRPQDIDRLEKAGDVKRTLDLYADNSGYVVEKNVVHGMRVMPSDTIFDIADLSRLWVLADVYESDLPAIRLGMQARVEVPYLPGRAWSGPVTYIAPTVEEKTRTVKVRVEVENRDDELKPDMYADVFLRSSRGSGIVVPDSAVIQGGDRSLVFLELGDGRFEPREVQLGARLGSDFQVLRGIAEGDRVVVSANFLLDSESSLRAALSSMSSPAPAGQHRH